MMTNREERLAKAIYAAFKKQESLSNEADAIAAWNQRAPIVVTDEMVKAAAKTYQRCIGFKPVSPPAMREALEAALNVTPKEGSPS